MIKIPKENPVHILSIGTKILIKDVMDQYLRSLGEVKTFYASKLSVAVESFNEKKPQLVFCEQFFSEGNALDFIKTVGGLHVSDASYFVLAVEEASDELLALAIEQNIDEILVKPFSTENIHQIVERYLSKRETQKVPWCLDLRVAREANMAKRFQVAEQLYSALVVKYPAQASLQLDCAEFFFHKLNFDQCLQITERVLAATPNNVRALQVAGAALKKMGRLREALDHLHRAIALSPLNNRRNIDIAEIHLLLADEQITQALKMDTENSSLILHKAKFMFIRKEYAAAVQYLDAKRGFLSESAKKESDQLLAFCKKLGGIK